MPLNVVGRKKMLCVKSTSTRTESLSTVGVSNAAPANSMQEKPPAAAPASAAEAFRKSRRFMAGPMLAIGVGSEVTSSHPPRTVKLLDAPFRRPPRRDLRQIKECHQKCANAI